MKNSKKNLTPYKPLDAIISSAIAAVDPYLAIKKCVSFKNGLLTVDGGASNAAGPQMKYFPFQINLSEGDLYVVGTGKAASRMSLAMEDIFGNTIRDGIAVTKYGYAESLKKIRQIEAGHPVPDKKGVQGVTEITHLLKQTRDKDLVVVLISGGGSALLPLPISVTNINRFKMIACAACYIIKRIKVTRIGELININDRMFSMVD